MNAPHHLSLSNEHYTDPGLLDRARQVLGRIELDPASSPTANQLVQADRIYTQSDDGLAQDWTAKTVWLNPPGGRLFLDGKTASQQALWLDRLEQFFRLGRIESALFLSFNLEILRHRGWLLKTPIAVFEKRPHFWSWDEESESLRPGQWSQRADGSRTWINNPSHPCLIACLTKDPATLQRFGEVFGKPGYAATSHLLMDVSR